MKSEKIRYRIFRCSKGETVWYEAKYKVGWKWCLLTKREEVGDYYVDTPITAIFYEDMVTYCTTHANNNRKTIKTLHIELEL